jgi:hypothetical protein
MTKSHRLGVARGATRTSAPSTKSSWSNADVVILPGELALPVHSEVSGGKAALYDGAPMSVHFRCRDRLVRSRLDPRDRAATFGHDEVESASAASRR